MTAEMDAYRADLAVQATQKTEDVDVLESETLAFEAAAHPPPAAQASQGKKVKPRPKPKTSKARGTAEPEVLVDVVEPDVPMDVNGPLAVEMKQVRAKNLEIPAPESSVMRFREEADVMPPYATHHKVYQLAQKGTMSELL
jgi:hypothetical protein